MSIIPLNHWSSGRAPLDVTFFAAVKTFDASIDNFVQQSETIFLKKQESR